jgi:hypothetical protein
MARPKKNQLSEQTVADSTPEVQVALLPVENTEPQVTEVPVQETPKAPENDLLSILPEIDRVEMDRYFRVINNSEQASRIMQAISHQRDLEMWGVHQYDKSRSRNTYARSFYFKDRQNAVKALDYTNKLLG